MSGRILVDLMEIAQRVEALGVPVIVDYAGGGTWRINAGRIQGHRAAIVAGPSASTDDNRIVGDVNDFYVGPDDEGLLRLTSVADRGATTVDQIAELIVRLTRETERRRDLESGCVLCGTQFAELDDDAAERWTFHWDHPLGGRIVAETCGDEHAVELERLRDDHGRLPALNPPELYGEWLRELNESED